ncbi:glycine dehydrogenase [Psychroserpens luteolus]|uniref:glycine dehydrogenase n=1 Tax=Psychroserpens luteolus TaxID=2855840 RepID=UPI001E555311|nr:glycine dehydrogenase [Psychroserpens luteolus]MCD2260462.1 glycine dehydrogenase [Psychroserpens luteolus]
MSNKIIIPCEEANHVCDKTQYKEATLWEKIKLNIHLLYCKACRKYTKNNTKLTKLVTKKPVTLDASSKEGLKSAFEKELAKHQ